MNMPRMLILSLLSTVLFVPVSYAEISGSGFRQKGCDSKIDLQLYVDVNGNGKHDSSDLDMEGVAISITRVSEPQLGTDSLISDGHGRINFFNMCPDTYLVELQSHTLPSGFQLDVVTAEGNDSDFWDSSDSGFSVHVPVGPDYPGHKRELELGFEDISCDVTLAASCSVQVAQSLSNVPSSPGYKCEKQISELTMIWAGGEAVRVMAHVGKLDDPVIADIDNVLPGAEVSIDGFADAPEDIIWEIFKAGTDIKLGESSFHLSCSDKDMKEVEDCGKAAGDGKDNKKCSGGEGSCLNDWIFEGLVDKEGEINCTADYPTNQVATGTSWCESSGPGVFNVQYSLTNTGSDLIVIQRVTDSVLGALPGVPSGAFLPEESETFFYSDQIDESQYRQLSVSGIIGASGESCVNSTVLDISVLPAPSVCESIDITLKSMSHDKLELEITNNHSEAVVVAGLNASWPAENQNLKEIKAQDGNVLTDEIAWQEVVYVTDIDFSMGIESRTVEAGLVQKYEFKFAEHVHDSAQLYDIDFDFGSGCSVNFNNNNN